MNTHTHTLTVGTAKYIIITQDIALALMMSDRPPVKIPPACTSTGKTRRDNENSMS